MKEIVYKNEWFSVLKDGRWHYLIEKNSDNGAVILMLEDNENFIFVKNHRKAIGKTVIELPRGYGEDNESSVDTAVREAYEETGYKIDKTKIVKLGTVNPNSAILSSNIDIYFAYVSKKDKIKDLDSEVLAIVKIRKDDVHHYINDGRLQDSFSLSAISLYNAKNL